MSSNSRYTYNLKKNDKFALFLKVMELHKSAKNQKKKTSIPREARLYQVLHFFFNNPRQNLKGSSG